MKIHSPTSRSPASDKRERILEAAERVFARSGFYQSRVAEIARDAGVADGTIYLYFKSKDDLLISLFESRMERVNKRMAAAIAETENATDQLLAVARTHLEMVRNTPELAEVLTIELRQSTKFMKEYANPRFGEFLKQIATVIADGQQTGEFVDTIPPSHAARMIFGIIDELALAWLLSRGENFDIAQASEWVGAMIIDGLKPRRPAPEGLDDSPDDNPAKGQSQRPDNGQDQAG